MAAKSATDAGDTVRESDGVVRVRELAALVDAALKRGVPAPVRVLGEVSGLRERTHLYFDLKDGDAVVSCVVFASIARKHQLRLRDGLEVVVSGGIEFYAKQGKLSLIARSVRLVGEGALDAAFRALCDELRGRGWFDDARKRPVPAFPRRIAVLTSRSGAALQDVIDTMRRRCPSVELLLIDSRVQGEAAAGELRRKLVAMSRRHRELGVDAVLITRGGGSAEDLWAFNDRDLAEAILKCPVPVVAAIGHETDTTIAELVADVRASTPTQAAMRLTPDAAALAEQIDLAGARLRGAAARRLADARASIERLGRRRTIAQPRSLVAHADERRRRAADDLRRAVRDRLRSARAGIDRAASRLERRRPAAELARREQRLDDARARLAAAMAGRVRREAERLDARRQRLRAVGPRAVLARGFSYTTLADGRLVRGTGDVRAGDTLVTTLHDGEVRSTVPGRQPPPPAKPAAARTSRRPRDDQPGLFEQDEH